MAAKLVVLVCEYLFEEAKSASEVERFEDVEIVPYAVRCAASSAEMPPLEILAEEHRKKGDRIFILGGACLAGLGKKVNGAATGPKSDFDQCFDMFVDRETVGAMIGDGAYLVTPGWVRRWKGIIREWGFDPPTARSYFAETMTRVVLLDTGTSPSSSADVREFAEFVGLPWSVHPAGLSHLRLFLRAIVLDWRLENERRKVADFAMLSDLAGEITRIAGEAETMKNVLHLFQTLFAPRRLVFLPITWDIPGEPVVFPEGGTVAEGDLASLRSFSGEQALLESGDGFRLRILHFDETLGLIEVRGLAFPEHREHYLNLALVLSRIAGLAISNARSFQRIQEERDRAQNYLKLAEKALREKELLLKELNHRVKNNFQMLASMLRLQSRSIHDPEALAVCKDMQSRIRSIAFVHERLYKSADLAAVDFALYIGQIVRELTETLEKETARIRVSVDVENVGLNINTSIPLGLIINELVANALKHAFPGGQSGSLEISLRAGEGDRFVLVVRDDGVGLPPGLDIRNTESLGLQLVTMLSEQLDGTVEIDRIAGTTFRIVFFERKSKND